MKWGPAGTSPVKGKLYRSTYWLNVPYSSQLVSTVASAVLAAGNVLRFSGVAIDSVASDSPGSFPSTEIPANVTPGGRFPAWRIRVYWRAV